MITGIEETLDSGVEICAGDDHERRSHWRVPAINGACMAACGLGAVGGPLAPLAGPLCFPRLVQRRALPPGSPGFSGLAGTFRVFALVDLSRRRKRACVAIQAPVGAVASTLAVNAFAFHYAHMTTILSNCKDVTKRIPYTLMNSVKKIALVGPGLVMAMMQLLRADGV